MQAIRTNPGGTAPGYSYPMPWISWGIGRVYARVQFRKVAPLTT